ncbi:MAG: hypothetical protein MJE68_16570 [Proteobacteria bacterium]|nr:hypothetical protein [Pseudomonadota bacterium]
MRALLSIFIWYRRQYLDEWFTEVLEKFSDCSTMPDYGRSVEWPHPPPALTVSLLFLRKCD